MEIASPTPRTDRSWLVMNVTNDAATDVNVPLNASFDSENSVFAVSTNKTAATALPAAAMATKMRTSRTLTGMGLLGEGNYLAGETLRDIAIANSRILDADYISNKPLHINVASIPVASPVKAGGGHEGSPDHISPLTRVNHWPRLADSIANLSVRLSNGLPTQPTNPRDLCARQPGDGYD